MPNVNMINLDSDLDVPLVELFPEILDARPSVGQAAGSNITRSSVEIVIDDSSSEDVECPSTCQAITRSSVDIVIDDRSPLGR